MTQKTARLLALCLLLLGGPASQAQSLVNERARWFTDARFGMFIHWGIYSGAEGYWKGEKLRYRNNYAEWIKYRNRISNDEYLTLLDRFAWDEIDPEEWVKLAKDSGMKYLTVTAKHHDGFALWDSPSSHYDLGDYARPKRDVVKELAEACRKHGIKLGLYYSHWVDWEHSGGWDHSREVYGLEEAAFDQYWQEKVIPQIRELLTNYGEISLLWFDMWLHHSETIVSEEQLLRLKSLIRELQPNCLVNSRLGLSIEEDPDIDFKTLGDNKIGNRLEDFPWQSPATVAHSWGFHSSDSQWKSTTTLLRSLINNASLNGNFMLNIGPRANGEVPYEISQRMLEMGAWLQRNGESIYGAGAFALRDDLHDWGRITCKETEDGFRLYLHVFNWPLSKTLHLTGVLDAPEKVYLLSDPRKRAIPFAQAGALTTLDLPSQSPDPYVSVIVLEYTSKPAAAEGLVAQAESGGYSLRPQNRIPGGPSAKVLPAGRRESIPEHLPVRGDTGLKWKLYIDQAGERSFDTSYSYQGDAGLGALQIRAAETTLSHRFAPTGKTVGDPNRDWVIDSFESRRVGTIHFPSPGTYEVEVLLSPAEGQEVDFQWIWIE